MAELINTNVFDANKKFVDFAGLDYFWEKAKAYVDAADLGLSNRIGALEETVGDSTKGLVKDVKAVQDVLDSLSTGDSSIATQIENAINALDVEDTAVAGEYVSSVSETDGKISVTRVALPDYTETYDAKGAAAQALEDAKDYADGLDAAMNTRVEALEAIDHDHSNKAELDKIVDGDKAKWDNAVGRLEAFLDGDKIEGTVDTLKEIQAWMEGDGVNATELTEAIAVETKNRTDADSAMDARIKTLEAIDHDAYIAADTVLETSVKGYADGKAADAQAAAIAQAKLDTAEALKAYYTKTEVDDLLTTNSTEDKAYAKQYTDELFGSFQFASNADIDALFEVE